MIPVCLRCNDVGKSSAIVMGTSHFLPNDSIENELVKCKHEVVSKALYTHSIVDVVESQNKECVLLKNSSKIHLAACFDGKTYATIVCKLSRSSTKGKCNSCKGVKCGHLTRWNKELGSSLLPDKAANERGDDLEEDSEELDDEEIKVLNRATLKFPLTETTQALFREYDSNFYDEKEVFADLPILGQKCSSHGNEWSDENPVEMDWCFSDQVKIAHTSFVKQRERKVYFRKAVKCDCKLLYEGDEDFLVRVGGSKQTKYHVRAVSLVSYGLLIDFTFDFMENGQTINGFYNSYKAKCEKKFGMKSDDSISLKSWKLAVHIFWRDILKLDLLKSFSCDSCGDRPPTLVFYGSANKEG